MKKALLIIGAALIFYTCFSQEVPPLWKDFVEAKKNGKTPILPDFSYAGYHFSEKPIPAQEGRRVFNVTDFGAVPDDENFDDEAIQAAIRAAEASPDGGVVFFPKGRFLIAPDRDSTRHIRISQSNIVLKGSGSQKGGTEIYQANMRINGRQFVFKPEKPEGKKLTKIIRNADRESFWVEVEDASTIRVGQDVVIRHRSEEYTRMHFGEFPLKPQWARLFGEKGGMQIFEIHTVDEIDGNRVRFRNPIHFDLQLVKTADFELHSFHAINECGIEDIRFSSNWKSYPEEFVHHKDAIHDYAYETIGMEYVKNSWVRNCVFEDINECLMIRSGYQISVIDNEFVGKKGHTSVHARTGYGVLIKNCRFNNAQHHGPGTGYSAVGTVITQCSLGTDQNFDIHSGQPIATLFDQIEGGVFYNLGGPEPGHPHHGRHLVLWNFFHRSNRDQRYNFWDMERRRNYTIPAPLICGFRSNTRVSFDNAGINQMQGKKVFPASLFEAQLALRLDNKDVNAKHVSSGRTGIDSCSQIFGPMTNFAALVKGKKKKITVTFMGGSITHMPGWRDLVGEWLQREYPDVQFRLVNAGIPSLGSLPHAFRFKTDVLGKVDTDLLFLESAVNDRVNATAEPIQKRALEGIIRQARKSNPKMDIVLMAFADQEKLADYHGGRIPTEVRVHEEIARHYKLPFVNLAAEVYRRIAAKEFTWKEDFKDLHPSPFGHKIYAESIKRLFAYLPEDAAYSDYSKIPTMDRFNYENGHYVSVHTSLSTNGFQKVNSWTPADGARTRAGFVRVPVLESNHEGSSLEIKFRGNAVGISVLAGPDAGIIAYSVDGSREKTVDLFTQWSKSLHLPWFVMLADGLTKKKHVLKIKLTGQSNPASVGTACRIVNFLVN